jgi:hypothetical protein
MAQWQEEMVWEQDRSEGLGEHYKKDVELDSELKLEKILEEYINC